MSFDTKLEKAKINISSFTNSPSTLMPKYIRRKLDRSLEKYIKELEINLAYLLYRDNKKVRKYVKKQIEKGVL